jgi:hypothetical protein
MSKIPTADEFLNKEYYLIVLDSKDTWVNVGDMERAMIEFAKLHVIEALKAASERAFTESTSPAIGGCIECNETGCVNKESILNAYPLTNIK